MLNVSDLLQMVLSLLFVGIIFIIFVLSYVATSLANVKVLKYFNHARTWAGWISIYGQICLTECMTEEDGKIDAFFMKIPKKYFIFWPIAVMAVNALVPYLGAMVAPLAATFFAVVVYKDLLSQESGKEEIGLGIVCGILPIVWVVMAFIKFKGQYHPTIIEVNSEL